MNVRYLSIVSVSKLIFQCIMHYVNDVATLSTSILFVGAAKLLLSFRKCLYLEFVKRRDDDERSYTVFNSDNFTEGDSP